MFLCLTAANALVAYQLAAWFAGRVYRRSYSGLFDRRPAARGRWLTWLDRAVARGAVPLPRTLRLLMINDLRVFRRDPVQWSQFLIFFGLLALYFLNVRRLSYDLDSVAWVNMVSFLNLGVVGLLLSTFTTRFIFPMTSLEGRRFWVLGRLPIPRDTFLWSKFAFAALGSLAACMPLVIISDVMLGVWSFVLGVHLAACAMFCLGLSGIAVGLGARVPNFKEESPSKIAAGFGGTLNLVLGTLYVIAVAALVGVPCHFFAVGRQIGPWTLEGYRWLGAPGTMWLGAAAGLALCLAATLVPLRLGLAAFRRQEF
jgi:ABC-2 type transport system permease protein